MQLRRSATAAAAVGLAIGLLTTAVPATAIARAAPSAVQRTMEFDLIPGSSAPVGIGQLVTLRFSRPVQARAAIEQAITVTSDRPLPPGAWGWVDDRTAVYRPQVFWPGHATITFTLNLGSVVLATSGGVEYLGAENRTHVMQTARNQVIDIVNRTHRMFVRRDGKSVKDFPVSLGKPGSETRSGIKILTGEKYTNLRMIGRDRDTGKRWDVRSPYSIRLTPGGEFMHGAPWAAYRLGKRNGSNGCTNMAVRDAKWLYHHVLPGDPVVTTGTGRKMKVTESTPGSYWNYTFRQWQAKSAL